MTNDQQFQPVESEGARPSHFSLEEETYAIVGSALEVYHGLGVGFAEAV